MGNYNALQIKLCGKRSIDFYVGLHFTMAAVKYLDQSFSSILQGVYILKRVSICYYYSEQSLILFY